MLAVLQSDRAPVELAQQIVQRRGLQVDQAALQRLLVGERRGLGHGLLGQRDVAMIRRLHATYLGEQVVLDLGVERRG